MFIPVPAGCNIQYRKARSTRYSETGQPYQRYSNVCFWHGSYTYEPQIDEGGVIASRLFGLLQQADQPGGFFYADLYTTGAPSLYTGTGSDAHRTLVDPQWFDVPIHPDDGPDLIQDSIILPAADVQVGTIISLRVNSQKEFVTARIVSKVENARLDNEGNVTHKKGTFNFALPLEFFQPNNFHSYCLNRPHVRAIILNDSASWTTRQHTIMPASFDWMEDTVGIINALSGGAGGASKTFIVKEDGTTRITKEDGTNIIK